MSLPNEKNHHNRKRGKIRDRFGYILLRCPDHPFAVEIGIFKKEKCGLSLILLF